MLIFKLGLLTIVQSQRTDFIYMSVTFEYIIAAFEHQTHLSENFKVFLCMSMIKQCFSVLQQY